MKSARALRTLEEVAGIGALGPAHPGTLDGVCSEEKSASWMLETSPAARIGGRLTLCVVASSRCPSKMSICEMRRRASSRRSRGAKAEKRMASPPGPKPAPGIVTTWHGLEDGRERVPGRVALRVHEDVGRVVAADVVQPEIIGQPLQDFGVAQIIFNQRINLFLPPATGRPAAGLWMTFDAPLKHVVITLKTTISPGAVGVFTQ